MTFEIGKSKTAHVNDESNDHARAAVETPKNPEILKDWFLRRRELLHYVACRALGGPEGADLVLQNCWLRASRNTPRFDSISEFRSWLLRVLIDEALIIRRSRRV